MKTVVAFVKHVIHTWLTATEVNLSNKTERRSPEQERGFEFLLDYGAAFLLVSLALFAAALCLPVLMAHELIPQQQKD